MIRSHTTVLCKAQVFDPLGLTASLAMCIRCDSCEIRPIRDQDLDAVLRVYQQCEDFLALGPQPTASMEMVLQDVAISQREGGIFCGIYGADGTMLGIVDYVPGKFEGDPHAAYLSLLMIGAPYRKQGLGRAVVELIENEIRRDAFVTTILSAVQVNNPAAIRFWQENGYRISGPAELQADQTITYPLQKDTFR